MQTDLVHRRVASETERPVSAGELTTSPPRPGELFFQAGRALAIPLALALIANVVLIAYGFDFSR
jgi:hypothetical protein